MLIVPPLLDYRALLTSTSRLVVSKVCSYEPSNETNLKSTLIDPITPQASYQASQHRPTTKDRTPHSQCGTNMKRPDLANGCKDPPQALPYTPPDAAAPPPRCRMVYIHIRAIHILDLGAPTQNAVTCLAAIRILSLAKVTPTMLQRLRVNRVTINLNVTFIRLTLLSVPR